MSNVAIIPARGGSKRIPRKNIKPFAGKPIMAWSIEAARGCGLFERVIVSTDDDEIAAIARAHGAEAPFVRPGELSDDHSGTLEVMQHALQWLGADGACPERACCIYATAPFVRPARLAEGLRALLDSGRSYAFSATSFSFPIQRAIRITASGAVVPMFPEHIASRSQDLEPAFHDAGQFYWGTSAAFLERRPLFSDAAVPVLLPRHEVQDIDTDEDWVQAELMFRAGRLADRQQT
jgi:N-acylneuraminate cytidylyltransferase